MGSWQQRRRFRPPRAQAETALLHMYPIGVATQCSAGPQRITALSRTGCVH